MTRGTKHDSVCQIGVMGNSIYRAGTVQVRTSGYDRVRAAAQTYLDLDSPLPDLIAVCRDAAAIARISALADQTYGNEKADYDCCVYAFEADGYCHTKIGISHIPLKRFAAIQQALFSDLKIAGLVWVSSHSLARKIERLVFRAADEMNIHARGEWLSTHGDEAMEIILKAARYAEANVADSQSALDNLSARVKALFDVKRSVREAIVF